MSEWFALLFLSTAVVGSFTTILAACIGLKSGLDDDDECNQEVLTLAFIATFIVFVSTILLTEPSIIAAFTLAHFFWQSLLVGVVIWLTPICIAIAVRRLTSRLSEFTTPKQTDAERTSATEATTSP